MAFRGGAPCLSKKSARRTAGRGSEVLYFHLRENYLGGESTGPHFRPRRCASLTSCSSTGHSCRRPLTTAPQGYLGHLPTLLWREMAPLQAQASSESTARYSLGGESTGPHFRARRCASLTSCSTTGHSRRRPLTTAPQGYLDHLPTLL